MCEMNERWTMNVVKANKEMNLGKWMDGGGNMTQVKGFNSTCFHVNNNNNHWLPSIFLHLDSIQ